MKRDIYFLLELKIALRLTTVQQKLSKDLVNERSCQLFIKETECALVFGILAFDIFLVLSII